MSKIWFCPTCGYEVTSRGRCHSCRERLVASSLPELAPRDEDDEVGYRLDGWVDRERGRLIERLNDAEVLHRFEDGELVVAIDDESRVDDLVAEVAASPQDKWSGESRDASSDAASVDLDEPDGDGTDEWATSAVRILAAAARRLREDPTDMHADGDVAEASAAVFTVDRFYGTDAETWAAVGRVTRRLLSALGDDEALEDEIRSQAAILYKLLEPIVHADEVVSRQGDRTSVAAAEMIDSGEAGSTVAVVGVVAGSAGAAATTADVAGANVEVDGADVDGAEVDGAEVEGAEVDDAEVDGADAEDLSQEDSLGDGDGGSETVYELPEWLPEQRAQLGILLEDVDIEYEWEGDDLVVPADRETEVEALFEQVGAPPGERDAIDDDDDGNRYRTLEELFAAADRLVNDPDDQQRATEAVDRIHEAAGPPPVGLDEVAWFHIMTQARALSESIGADRGRSVILEEAKALRDLLRGVV